MVKSFASKNWEYPPKRRFEKEIELNCESRPQLIRFRADETPCDPGVIMSSYHYNSSEERCSGNQLECDES
jgi:hypothetical protein